MSLFLKMRSVCTLKSVLIGLQAFVALVRREQEETEWKRKKEEDERKGKKEEQLLRTRLLEAAFDGEAEEVLAIPKVA